MSVRTLRTWRLALLPLAFVATAATANAQANVTSPKAFFGHNIGDDYWLPNYDQFEAYWHKIDAESDRMRVIEIGKTSEGRPQLAAIITAPENFKNLERYRQISLQLASGKGLTAEQARALSREGKAVVWVDGGLHATEVLGANQLIETSYQLVSRTDEETNRVLRDDIILMVHANPDGMQLVANWYMQEKDSLARNMNIPVLYNKYAGHDDNRDLYMSNLAESKNINHLMFWDWHPVIMYDHHQTGPAGTVMFSPPFRDPFNYTFDPMLVMGEDMVGAAIHTRLLQDSMPGFTMRSGSSYSTWWNGGLRTIGYFQNIIGILTETIGNPTPETIPFLPEQQLPRGDLPAPVTPGVWHFRRSIDYSVAANYSIFDLASRYKDELLWDKWHMAHDQVERGSTDSWTITSDVIDEANAALARAAGPQQGAAGRGGAGGGRGGRVDEATSMKVYNAVMRNPATRDPRGFIIPSSQPDFPTATKLINTLRNLGIVVDRATAAFTVAGKQYPAGSYVVKTDQEGRPQVLDTFEPQHYPNDFAYPGGPPVRPYDDAGWTLAYTMGVKFDRVLDAFDGPFQPIDGLAKTPAGTIASASDAKGYLMSHQENDAFTVVNRVLGSGGSIFWLQSPMTVGGVSYPAGTFYVSAQSLPVVQKAAAELGVSFTPVTTLPPADARPLTKQRVALFDQYGGSMPSGWTRYELEAFEFPYQLVYPQDLDAGNLKSRFDVLILPSGASIRGAAGDGGFGGRGGGGGRTAGVPAEYQHMLGSMTTEKTVPQLKQFLEQGGTIITVGSASSLGYDLGLPLENYLTQRSPGQAPKALTGEQYYVPGSVLSVAVDTTQPAAAGLSAHTDVFFNQSPVFRLGPDAALRGVHPIAWFDTTTPLRSGWAWGQNYLEGGTTAVEADVGKGHLYLYGPEITFRGQPHGTFKFLFNGIYAPSKAPDVVP